MQRTAPRLTRILACAAVPVMLVVAGCSSDSGDGAKGSKDKAGAPSSATPSPSQTTKKVEPAKFAELPQACKSISAKTTASLVPKAKTKNGTPAISSDLSSRTGCSWNGLDDKGVKGSQYRWLDVGFTRFDSDQALGSGAERAQQDFEKQVAKAKDTAGAKKVAEAAANGIGEQATKVTYELTKTSEDFKYATVVARTGNVVVTLTYNGAGYAGAKTPSSEDIVKGAEKAAKEAVAAVSAADAEPSKSADPNGSTTSGGSSGKDDDDSDDKPKSRKTSAHKSSTRKTT